jgi:hypothetical protein
MHSLTDPTTLNEVTLGLIQDLRDLRAKKITNADARTRAQLAREILRSLYLTLEGMRFIEAHNSPPALTQTPKAAKK